MSTLVVYKDYLRSGRGADRAVAWLLGAMIARGYAVHLVTAQPEALPFSVSLPPGVAVHRVPEEKRRWFHLRRSDALQRTVDALSPDAVIAAGPNEIMALTDPRPPRAPLIMMFHTFPPAHFKKRSGKRLARALRAAAAIQVLLPSHAATLRPLTQAPIEAIGNAVAFAPPPEEGVRENVIVYIAYFNREKRQDFLIRAFARIAPRYPHWRLDLYGSGSPAFTASLEKEIARHGLENQVRLCGVTDAPQTVFSRAAICAFPSAGEGFGLSLVEAMGCALPCVGLATAPSVNELIEAGQNGLLTPPCEAAYADALAQLMDDPALRQRLGTTAMAVRAVYAPELIAARWDAFISAQLRR